MSSHWLTTAPSAPETAGFLAAMSLKLAAKHPGLAVVDLPDAASHTQLVVPQSLACT